MTASHVPTRRRWLLGGLAVVGVLAVAGLAGRALLLRDSATPVPAGDALDEFRSSTTTRPSTAPPSTVPPTTVPPTTVASTVPPTTVASTAPPAAGTEPSPAATAPPGPAPGTGLPAPGVYRYRTAGREAIDALGGAAHDYPAETTITVTERGCGVWMRWDALRERRDEWGLCVSPDGVELVVEGVQYHEFFGQPDEEPLRCDRPVVLVPAAEPGAGPGAVPARTELTCALADDPWFPVWETVGWAVRTVGGREIPVLHVRMTVVDEDEFWEDNTADWYLAGNGLPIEVVVSKASRSPSPIGGVEYEETYRIELIDLDPLR